ncbi:GntR family transcriptional regulator [Spiroplasma floricola]|nr:GntR family transcriptional regulator [Spiroplasma floricola]
MNKSKMIEEYLLKLIKENNKVKTFPSENFLATKFKTTRQTARNELLKLLNKGFLKVKKGSGYYINPHISTIKLTSMGEKLKEEKKEVFEHNSGRLPLILENLNIKNANESNFHSYRKIYYRDKEESFYIDSFINKEVISSLDLFKIKNSLIDFINENEIELDNQINYLKMEPKNKDDIEILKDNVSNFTPVVYGILFSKENKIIEIFERRYKNNTFDVRFSKFY